MKIMHLISGLKSGGAESTLFKLVKNDINNIHIVVSLTDGGSYKSKLEEESIEVHNLNFKFNLNLFYQFFKLILLIKKIKPNAIQSWMYYCNFITIFIKLFCNINIYWNIRASFYKQFYTPFSKFIIYFSALASHIIPKKIVYCSYSSIRNHEKIFFSKKKSVFIANGFDVIEKKNFQKDIKILNQYKLNSKNIIFSMIARYDPHKDHIGLINKFINIIDKNNSVILILIGRNINNMNTNLNKIVKKNNLSQKIILLDHINDLEKMYSIIDFHILLSFSESFPNVIAETMARGIPNISSDVGHASEIINQSGWIIKNKDEIQFKKAVNEAINLYSNKKELSKLKIKCLNSISHKFNIQSMIINYNELWKSINEQ